MKRLSLTLIPFLSLLILPTTPAFPRFFSSNSHPVLVAQSLSTSQIHQLAKDITVKVTAAPLHGSGVLIDKQGHTYTVVTNAHVLTTATTAQIQTPDGKIYQAHVLHRGSSLQGIDLAVLQFQSPDNYHVVALAPESQVLENQSVYAAGFAYDTPDLVLTSGKIALIAPKPLVGGYQIGYTNEIQQGMSGGPLLNAEGKLIGINGLLAQAILNDAYLYQDGTQPSRQWQQRLQASSLAVPSQTLAQVAPELAVLPRSWQPATPHSSQPLLTAGVVGQIDRIANEITLRIDSQQNGNGSGVLIAHQGPTYYVLTALHVVQQPDSYTVVTPDGEQHPVPDKDIVKAKGLDVAILKFTSTHPYTVATLARYNLTDSGTHWIFFSGFPGRQATTRKLSPGFRFSRDELFFQPKDTTRNLSNGYELVYTNISLPGMSGGPLLDTQGRVIGIGGRQEGEPYSEKLDRNLGYALGVPISKALGLASRTGLKPEWMKLETAPPPDLTPEQLSLLKQQLSLTAQPPPESSDENVWLNYGNQLWRLQNFEAAAAALNKAIELNPDFYLADYALGLVQESQGKYQAALATLKQVTHIKPDYYPAWREQSIMLDKLNQYPQALVAINQAIQLNSEQASSDSAKDFILYVDKASLLTFLERYLEAEAVLTQAIKIKPSDLAYYIRGFVRFELKNYQQAEADYTQAITLNPQLAQAYNNRGNLRKELKNYQQAEADFTQAIALNPQFAAAYNNRGNLREELKNYQQAEADYTQAITLNPQFAAAYYNRGLLRDELKNYQQAEADYTQAIALNPQFAAAYFYRGNLRKELKNYQQAEADYTQGITLNHQDTQAYNNRGIVRAELKNYQQAEADFTQAIALNPQDADAYINRGHLRYELKNYQQAEADLQTAAKLFRAQGNMDGYQEVQDLLSQLSASPK